MISPTRMKIALVVPGGVDRSGEYRVIPAILALLRHWSMEHEVCVYSLAPEPSAGSWTLAGATIKSVGPVHGTAGLVDCYRAIRAIRRDHEAAPFDVIQSLWAGWPGFIAVVAARLLGIPGCVHVAGGELVSIPEVGFGGRQRWPGRVRERFVLRSAALVTAASEPMLEQIRALGFEGRRIPLGVDRVAWPLVAPVARDIHRPAQLIHVASLNRVKDQATLLRAMKILADGGRAFTLDVVGEDTRRGEIHALAEREGLAARIRFHGFQTQAVTRSLMLNAHIHLITSRHEAGPLVFLEAAMSGIPSVSTAVGHPREYAPDAALCVPIGDAAAFAAAVASLLDDEERRLSIATAAQQRAATEDAGATAVSFVAEYSKLLRGSLA